MVKILIVENQRANRNNLTELLKAEKYDVTTCECFADLENCFKESNFNLVLYSSIFPQMDGTQFLEYRKRVGLDIPILMMIPSNSELSLVIKYIKEGAEDIIEKPINLTTLLLSIRKLLKNAKASKCERPNRRRPKNSIPEITGNAPSIVRVRNTIRRVAQRSSKVLVTGANGTGKELVAKWLHEYSDRNRVPMIEVNCAAIPNELIESVLFGHEKGAFTGADSRYIGHFEQANGGVLFLDEIGDMSLSAQAKVLRALQEQKIGRVGGTQDIEVDVMVVAATNKNLRQEIEKGTFREDLYHRLNVIHIHVPSLSERRDDIPELVDLFVKTFSVRQKVKTPEITPDAMLQLIKRPWTGNIRELQNIVERLVIMCDNKITSNDIELYCRE